MTTTVKHFHSAMTGAPVLSGTAGALIAVLDACLVNGFGLKTADSVVVSGGIATATFSTGHSFEPDVIALVAGATPAGLNGENRVLTTSTNTITFDATDIADGTATGAIMVKLAPAGWAKEFNATNLAAYRSSDVTGTRLFLRVDDTGTTNARVVGYVSMSDINSGINPFPTPEQLAGGGWWPKANAANPAARAWTVIADSKTIVLHIHTRSDSPGVAGSAFGFGDFLSNKSVDPYACSLRCATSDLASSLATSIHSHEFVGLTETPGPFAARSFTGLGGAVPMLHAAESYFSAGSVTSGDLGSNNSTPTYPNPADNGLLLSRKMLVEPSVSLRGIDRGVFVVPQKCASFFAWRDKVDGQGAHQGRKLMAIRCGGPAANSAVGLIFIDITGPWPASGV